MTKESGVPTRASHATETYWVLFRGQRYLTASAAARITGVPPSTFRRWLKAGWTSFGMSLDVARHKSRLLVPELNALAAQNFLHDHPLPKPGAPREKREEFKRAAQWFGLIRPRSTYSRVRQPQRQPVSISLRPETRRPG